MSNNLKSIHLLPRLSEKSYSLSNSRVYVVDISRNTNKLTVKKAIESQFSVVVTKVNITNISGKKKRSISKNGRRVSLGKDNSIKKAYITLAEGLSLPFFDSIEEEEKKVEKVQKEIDKQKEKETKPKKIISRKKKINSEEVKK
jgi:large subunit ribosomal protein L23